MSKDFGIAGIRAGYSIMMKTKLKICYLMVIYGTSLVLLFIFLLYLIQSFLNKYNEIRKLYIKETKDFLDELSKINLIKVYPSKANFALIELPNNISSFDFTIDLLIKYGIYVRDCNDKVGLNGNFIRIASRGKENNSIIIDAIKNYIDER